MHTLKRTEQKHRNITSFWGTRM